MLGSGSDGGEGIQKYHYHEATCTIGLQDHCQQEDGVDDSCFIEGDEAVPSLHLHMYCFLHNQSTMTDRYGEKAGEGRGRDKTKRKYYPGNAKIRYQKHPLLENLMYR